MRGATAGRSQLLPGRPRLRRPGKTAADGRCPLPCRPGRQRRRRRSLRVSWLTWPLERRERKMHVRAALLRFSSAPLGGGCLSSPISYTQRPTRPPPHPPGPGPAGHSLPRPAVSSRRSRSSSSRAVYGV